MSVLMPCTKKCPKYSACTISTSSLPVSPPIKDSSMHIMVPITNPTLKNAPLPTKKSALSGPYIKGLIGKLFFSNPVLCNFSSLPHSSHSLIIHSLWHPCKKKTIKGQSSCRLMLMVIYGLCKDLLRLDWCEDIEAWVLKDISFKTMQVAILMCSTNLQMWASPKRQSFQDVLQAAPEPYSAIPKSHKEEGGRGSLWPDNDNKEFVPKIKWF